MANLDSPKWLAHLAVVATVASLITAPVSAQEDSPAVRGANPMVQKTQIHRIMTMSDPLRIGIVGRSFYDDTPEGTLRNYNAGSILAGARFNEKLESVITLSSAEDTIKSLTSSLINGHLYDAPTFMLGVRQLPRYSDTGRDGAVDLAKNIAVKALQSKPGSLIAKDCNFTSETTCHYEPVTNDELSSVLVNAVPISQKMNPSRGTIIGPAMASIMSFISAADQPDLVTGNKTTKQFLAEYRVQNPNVVADNRAVVASCIRQANTKEGQALDLETCARAGARLAVYTLALNNLEFVETSPATLKPTPDASLSEQILFARDLAKRRAARTNP